MKPKVIKIGIASQSEIRARVFEIASGVLKPGGSLPNYGLRSVRSVWCLGPANPASHCAFPLLGGSLCNLPAIYYNCGKSSSSGGVMTSSTSIRIEQKLYEQARSEAAAEHRTIAGQVEYWAKVGRAALDNPDLPVGFIAESLASMAEPREDATPFKPRTAK
jgi:hypothetical protein